MKAPLQSELIGGILVKIRHLGVILETEVNVVYDLTMIGSSSPNAITEAVVDCEIEVLRQLEKSMSTEMRLG